MTISKYRFFITIIFLTFSILFSEQTPYKDLFRSYKNYTYLNEQRNINLSINYNAWNDKPIILDSDSARYYNTQLNSILSLYQTLNINSSFLEKNNMTVTFGSGAPNFGYVNRTEFDSLMTEAKKFNIDMSEHRSEVLS